MLNREEDEAVGVLGEQRFHGNKVKWVDNRSRPKVGSVELTQGQSGLFQRIRARPEAKDKPLKPEGRLPLGIFSLLFFAYAASVVVAGY
ncbi:hypothetical protein GCM10027348_23570 [Hymenobacter tenuis]